MSLTCFVYTSCVLFIDSLLLPEFYQKNVLDLAGLLDFGIEDISYLAGKENPFGYLLKVWYEKDGKFATLNSLRTKVKELGRPDVEQLVVKAIEGVCFSCYNISL